MASINVIIDTKKLEAKLSRLEKQALPAATVKTVNALAFDSRLTTQKYMGLVFDRPTPFMLRGVQVHKATPQLPVSEVFMRNDAAKGTPPTKVLRATSRGIQRRQKRAEVSLYKAGLLGVNEGWVPGDDMKLDRYGNVSAAKVRQMLSQVRAFSEVGYKANATKASNARNKNRAQFFSPNPSTRNRLKPGIYERYGERPIIKKGERKGQRGLPRQIRPMMLFVPLGTYPKTFDMPRVVEQDVNRRKEATFRRFLAAEVRRLR